MPCLKVHLQTMKFINHTLILFCFALVIYTWGWKYMGHLDGLVQDCSNQSALAMELLQSCNKPSMCSYLSGFLLWYLFYHTYVITLKVINKSSTRYDKKHDSWNVKLDALLITWTCLPLDKMAAAISQTTFSNAFFSMKSFVFWLNFIEVCLW